MSAPHPTLIQWLVDDSDPTAGYCRICARFGVQKFHRLGVCDDPCLAELRWRFYLFEAGEYYRRPTEQEAHDRRPRGSSDTPLMP